MEETFSTIVSADLHQHGPQQRLHGQRGTNDTPKNTLGRPFSRKSRSLSNRAALVNLATSIFQASTILQSCETMVRCRRHSFLILLSERHL
jgi:hypothetical protein